jgi:ribosomal protein S18 acetylase RimI-like enzyme
MNLKIREAVKSDITILAKNNQALANETENINLNLDTLISGVSNALDREDCHYFVAETNKIVVGQTLITYEWSDWRNGLIWWMQSVFVLSNFRKQGVYRTLFNHIQNLARNNPKVKALRLYVIHNNQSGIKTYEALGMKDSGYIVYEKEALD